MNQVTVSEIEALSHPPGRIASAFLQPQPAANDDGPTAEEIWKTLSAIDCADKIEKKGNLSYLSWAWAWGTLMQHYPYATHEVLGEKTLSNGTVETWCRITIGSVSRTMWLAVMDYKNKAIELPETTDINYARMRCLAKCLAMFGLGHYIYAGEDVPPVAADQQHETLMTLIGDGSKPLEFLDFWLALSDEEKIDLYNSAPKGQKVKLKKRITEVERMGFDDIDGYEDSITELALAEDSHALSLMEEASEYGDEVKKLLWGRLAAEIKQSLKAMKEQAGE